MSRKQIPRRYRGLHVFTDDPKKREIIEELGAAEAKNRKLVKVLEEAKNHLLTFGLAYDYIDAALKTNAVHP